MVADHGASGPPPARAAVVAPALAAEGTEAVAPDAPGQAGGPGTSGQADPPGETERPDRVVRGADVARILFATKATARPGRGRLLARLAPQAPLGGGEAQYAVTAQRVLDGRLHVRVLLPQRPNGAAGWVRGDDVALSRTRWRIGVDLRARRVTVARDGRRVKTIRAVVGSAANPTPTGRFAVSELLAQRPATGFFGSWVVPLTAFSPTLTEYMGGPGRVALHGRGGASLADPLGTATSHGCIRIPNADANWLARRIEPGVPVTIR